MTVTPKKYSKCKHSEILRYEKGVVFQTLNVEIFIFQKETREKKTFFQKS